MSAETGDCVSPWPPHLRQFIPILAYRPVKQLLAQEPDKVVRGHLFEAMLMNFCPEGIEPARQHILKTAKSLEMLEVRSALLAACLLLGKTFPEFPAWKEDSKHNSEFRRQWYKDHPIKPIAVGAEIENSEISDDILTRMMTTSQL